MIDCTILIMTFNEEYNIRRCLDSLVGEFTRICVVDSHSTDETLEILKEYPTVEIYKNTFLSWADQRNWLFEKAKVSSAFTCFLDADESFKPALVHEIDSLVTQNTADIGRFHVQNIFMGKIIKYAYGHPSITRLFRTSLSPHYSSEGAREYIAVQGKEVQFITPLWHEDLKPVTSWLYKHISNAKREAVHLGDPDKAIIQGTIKSFIRVNIWLRLPIFVRPFLYFVYRYFLRLGFLDGKPGLVYCFFQALSYQLMISTLLHESLRDGIDNKPY